MAVVAAWLWRRPTLDNAAALSHIGLPARVTLTLWPFADLRAHTRALDEQRLLQRQVTRYRVLAAAMLLPLLLLVLSADQDLPDRQATNVPPTSPTTKAEPGDEAPEVRTYLRDAADTDTQPIDSAEEEPDDEPLEAKRTPTRLYATAKVKPIYDNEDLLGVSIGNVRKASFWEMVGFRDDDVVVEVNGELMDTPGASVNFLNSMNSGNELIIRVRGADNVERMLSYVVPRDE
jgi:hypothetical protein